LADCCTGAFLAAAHSQNVFRGNSHAEMAFRIAAVFRTPLGDLLQFEGER